jgi:thiamine-phosphate pyrophosphorylase
MLIYVITDRLSRPDLPPEAMIDAVAQSGADMMQIREKDLGGGALLGLVRRAVQAQGAEVYVNGRIDVALASGAAGVHLPADGAGPGDVRGAWGARLKVGASTHTLDEARAAQAQGADFITFGPVFDTPSKRRFGAPVGPEALEAVLRAVSLPVFAIGGIDAARLRRMAPLPLAGVAVIGAVVSAADMREAVARLKEAAL